MSQKWNCLTASIPGLILLSAGVGACHVDRQCWPSPDSQMQACVSDTRPYLDGPAQRLWIRTPDERREVARLAPDAEWCDEALWDSQSRAVVFVVQSRRAVVVNPATASVLRRIELVEGNGYPGSRLVRKARLNGQSLAYLDCSRNEPDQCVARTVSLGSFFP